MPLWTSDTRTVCGYTNTQTTLTHYQCLLRNKESKTMWLINQTLNKRFLHCVCVCAYFSLVIISQDQKPHIQYCGWATTVITNYIELIPTVLQRCGCKISLAL